MTKEKFLFIWVHNYIIPAVQSIIAIEDYMGNTTVGNLYYELIDDMDDAIKVFDKVCTSCANSDAQESDAVLESYIAARREDQIKRFLECINNRVLPLSNLKSYNVTEAYKDLQSKKNKDNKNIFQLIISDIRNQEERS